MTIPNVTMRWCRKKAICKWCEQPVEIGTPMVAVMFWNKGNKDNRSWNVQNCYHPDCWVRQGLDYLERNPYVPHVRVRTLKLDPEVKKKRLVLMRQFHALNQRKNNIKVDYPDSLLVEQRLTRQMIDIMLDVANLGGIPKSWVEKLA